MVTKVLQKAALGRCRTHKKARQIHCFTVLASFHPVFHTVHKNGLCAYHQLYRKQNLDTRGVIPTISIGVNSLELHSTELFTLS